MRLICDPTSLKLKMQTLISYGHLCFCSMTVLMFSGHIQGQQCPGQNEPLCNECINDTAICSRRCVYNLNNSKEYLTQICTGHRLVIQNVDLSHNSLEHLDCTVTSSIKLRTLKISFNNITIEDCTYWEENCFNTFKYLEYIDLSFNSIKNFCNHSVFSLRRLKHVNLSHNEITSLENLPFFSEANNIRVADLSYNNISYLPWNLFQNKPYLISLNISFNNFQQFWFCHNLLLNTSHIFDFQIYRSNVSSPNDTGSSNDMQSQPSNLRTCNVSISNYNITSSLCHEDIQCSITNERLLFHRWDDRNVSDRSETPMCIYKVFSSCYLSEVGTTPLLTDIPTTHEGTSYMEKESSSTKTPSTENTVWRSLHGATQTPPRVILTKWLLVSCLSLVLSVCFLLFITLLTLKLLQIIKERQYTQRLKYSDTCDIYTEINTQQQNVTNLQDTMDTAKLSAGDITREGCYFTIPGLEDHSSSLDEVSYTEGSVSAYAVPNFTEGCPYLHSDDGNTSSNAIRNLRPLPQKISTESTGGSICYYTLTSSCEDIDKDDYGIYSASTGIDGDDISQGAHAYEKPFLGEMSNCSQTTKESTSNVLEASFHNSNCLNYKIKTGRFKFKDTCLDTIGGPNRAIEVGMDSLNPVRSVSLDMMADSCCLERSKHMDQNVPVKENALNRNKSRSFDMLTNPCYDSATSHIENTEISQGTSEFTILDDRDPSERLHNYDQSFPLTKLESSNVVDTLLDERNQNDCVYSMGMCRSKKQGESNQQKTASANVLDVHDDVLNADQIETPEMIMNPWYQQEAFHSDGQSSNKSESPKQIENPFEFEITNTEDLTMLRNPCYMPINVTPESGDTDLTSGDVD